MAGSSNQQHARTPDWQRLESLASRFEAAWAQIAGAARSVDLDPYLPAPTDPLRLKALHELIAVDLEMRWKRGRGVELDYYQKQYPELGPSRTLPATLIFEEYRVRCRYGDHPSLDLYRTRFPDQFPHLVRLIEQDRSLKAPPSTSPETPPLPAAASVDSAPSTMRTMRTPATQPPPDSKVVSVHGDYRLIRRLGSGAFGQVYMAEAPGGTEVAVKIITRPLSEREAQQELQALEHVKRIRHPYLVQTHAAYTVDDRLHIVMELADGSLGDRARQCCDQGLPGIPLDELLRYFAEAAEALDYLHTKEVHHRDIKPANILLLGGHAKLADFGLARALLSQTSMVDASMCGTPMYMAPEVWRSKVSRHSDQWSLAATYAELRLNRRLFDSRSMPVLMVSILEGNYDLDPLPEAEQAVLRRALSSDPRERYPTCKAFVEALEEALHPPSLPETVVMDEAEKGGRTQPGNRWGKLAVAALLGCFFALCYVVYTSRNGSPHPNGSAPVPRLQVSVPLPVQVGTGREVLVPIRIQRENFEGEVRIGFEGDLPPHVTIQPQVIEKGTDEALVRVAVAQAALSRTHKIGLRVEGDGPAANATLTLSVLFLPPNFETDGETVTDGEGVSYYKRIVFTGDAERIPFLLIPQKTREERQEHKVDPLTFYIMQDKVSLGQFRKFASLHPEEVKTTEWKKGVNEQHPAVGMSVEEAYRFARVWLHGNLPTVNQWDKASGRYESPRGDGPYRGNWENDEPKPDIAVGRSGPALVGSSASDISPFGCRDMAGNGHEWTRNLKGGTWVVPVEHPQLSMHVVYMRGHSFNEPAPFRYVDLDKESSTPVGLYVYREPDPGAVADKGFRVVIEP